MWADNRTFIIQHLFLRTGDRYMHGLAPRTDRRPWLDGVICSLSLTVFFFARNVSGP